MMTEQTTAITMREGDDAVGATSRAAWDWHQIDWYTAQRTVRRLQARIVQATREGSPRSHHRETASGTGRWKGLSCLTGNCPEQCAPCGALSSTYRR